ncbi:hypothetical protein QFC22_006539 [Naganishia vaughanmartiniae]|uniref:Uncharacterized protein n=1 Tax=Naganishia vaughanmartiniae TaxID=1424756 RepID=A0ACC2WJ91_9TREE|nr:hypothetical protein QFC22_006539 [Naganishia vaughanmartiniae]
MTHKKSRKQNALRKCLVATRSSLMPDSSRASSPLQASSPLATRSTRRAQSAPASLSLTSAPGSLATSVAPASPASSSSSPAPTTSATPPSVDSPDLPSAPVSTPANLQSLSPDILQDIYLRLYDQGARALCRNFATASQSILNSVAPCSYRIIVWKIGFSTAEEEADLWRNFLHSNRWIHVRYLVFRFAKDHHDPELRELRAQELKDQLAAQKDDGISLKAYAYPDPDNTSTDQDAPSFFLQVEPRYGHAREDLFEAIAALNLLRWWSGDVARPWNVYQGRLTVITNFKPDDVRPQEHHHHHVKCDLYTCGLMIDELRMRPAETGSLFPVGVLADFCGAMGLGYHRSDELARQIVVSSYLSWSKSGFIPKLIKLLSSVHLALKNQIQLNLYCAPDQLPASGEVRAMLNDALEEYRLAMDRTKVFEEIDRGLSGEHRPQLVLRVMENEVGPQVQAKLRLSQSMQEIELR